MFSIITTVLLLYNVNVGYILQKCFTHDAWWEVHCVTCRPIEGSELGRCGVATRRRHVTFVSGHVVLHVVAVSLNSLVANVRVGDDGHKQRRRLLDNSKQRLYGRSATI